MRDCVRCEKAFEPWRRDQKYCCAECAKARNPQNRCSVCGEVTPKNKYKYCSYACQLASMRVEHEDATCSCGSRFTKKTVQQRYCSQVCRREYDYVDRLKHGTVRENPGYFDCKRCSVRTPLSNPKSQRYLCDTCKAEDKQAKRDARLVGQCSPVPWKECPACSIRFVGRSNRKYCSNTCTDRAHGQLVQLLTAECRQCGTSFDRIPGQGWRRNYCSDRCSRRYSSKQHRQHGRGKRRGMPTIQYIGDRDNWTCHICQKHIARQDITRDHLIPVAEGGSNEASNIRAAHRLCNSKRGAGRIAAQLLLVG